MTRRAAVRSMAALAAVAVWGCARESSEAPELVAGDAECAYCRMLIDETRLAAQFVPASGARVPFGEVGCMVAWLAERKDLAGTAWVMTGERRWVRAADATYDIGMLRTPMRFDITARATAGGLSWDALRSKGVPDVRST